MINKNLLSSLTKIHKKSSQLFEMFSLKEARKSRAKASKLLHNISMLKQASFVALLQSKRKVLK